jgi:hypothetical protein
LIHISENHTNWVVKALHERIIPGTSLSFVERMRFAIFSLMARNSQSADQYFKLGEETNLSIEILPVRF